MVAITVILAAVIAAFVLDLGDTSQSASGAFDVNQDGNGDMTITTQNADRLDEVHIRAGAVSDSCDVEDGDDIFGGSPSVGETASTDEDDFGFDDCDEDDEFNIIGEYDGDETIIQSFELDSEDYEGTT